MIFNGSRSEYFWYKVRFSWTYSKVFINWGQEEAWSVRKWNNFNQEWEGVDCLTGLANCWWWRERGTGSIIVIIVMFINNNNNQLQHVASHLYNKTQYPPDCDDFNLTSRQIFSYQKSQVDKYLGLNTKLVYSQLVNRGILNCLKTNFGFKTSSRLERIYWGLFQRFRFAFGHFTEN